MLTNSENKYILKVLVAGSMKSPFKKILTPIFVFFAILFIIPVYCTAAGTSSSPSVEKHKKWIIEYAISGGFAGIQRQLTLSSSGQLTAADKKFKKLTEQQISQEQLMEIGNILEQLDFSINEKNASRLGGKCADCFQYTLTLSVNDKKTTAILNDLTLQDSKYTQLIRFLSALMEQALKNK